MDSLLNVIFIFLATVALGLMFGLTILRTIDSRLSEVSINIPEIKVPEAHVNVNFPQLQKPQYSVTLPPNQNDPPYQLVVSEPNQRQPILPQPNQYQSNVLSEPNQSNVLSEQNQYQSPVLSEPNQYLSPVLSEPNQYRSPVSSESNQYRSPVLSESNQYRSTILSDPNQRQPALSNQYQSTLPTLPNQSVINNMKGGMRQPDLIVSNYYKIPESDSICEKSIVVSTCPNRHEDERLKKFNKQLQDNMVASIRAAQPLHQNPMINGTTPDRALIQEQHYKHPDFFTPKQKIKFMLTANLSKMSPIDYKNWLLCFKDKSHNLNMYHQQMLHRIVNGYQPVMSDIPV